MLGVDQEVPRKEESATTLSSVTLTSNSGSEMVVGEINKDKSAESQGKDEEDHVEKVRDDGDTEAHNKRPWFPKLSLCWKQKQKEHSEHKTANLLGFFTGLNPKKSASIYSTLDEPDKGSSSAQNTLERGSAMKDDDDDMPKPEERSKSQWRLRFDPRRFRRLSQFADFSRRKWRGLRRASSSVGFRIRNTFSKLSLKRSSSATQPGAEAGVSTVSSHVPDFGRSFTLSVDSYEFGDDALNHVTDPPTFGVQEIAEGEVVFKDLQDPIAERSQSTDPNRTPTPPILATNSHAEDL